MDMKILRRLGTAAALLIGLITASPALATGTGVQTLNAVGAIDVWTFTCPSNTSNPVEAQANVSDDPSINIPACIDVVLGKAGFASKSERDCTEDGVPSLIAQVIGGSGLYAVAFKKTAGGGNERYVGNVICRNAAGAIFNPAIFRQINQ